VRNCRPICVRSMTDCPETHLAYDTRHRNRRCKSTQDFWRAVLFHVRISGTENKRKQTADNNADIIDDAAAVLSFDTNCVIYSSLFTTISRTYKTRPTVMLVLGLGLGVRGLALAKNSRPKSWQITKFTINFHRLEHGDWSELYFKIHVPYLLTVGNRVTR